MNPLLEIFSQGEEIVTGQTVDTNAAKRTSFCSLLSDPPKLISSPYLVPALLAAILLGVEPVGRIGLAAVATVLRLLG